MQQIASELFDEIPDEVEVDFVDTVAAPLPDDHDRPDARRPARGPRPSSAGGRTRSSRCRTSAPRRAGLDRDRATSSSSATTSASSSRTAPRTRATTCSRSSPRRGGRGSPSSSTSSCRWRRSCSSPATRRRAACIAGAGQAHGRAPRPAARSWSSDPELIARAVEEFLRYVTPVTHMCRTALDDVELRGQQIRQGRLPLPAVRGGEPRRGRLGARRRARRHARHPTRRTSRSGSPSTSASARTSPGAKRGSC